MEVSSLEVRNQTMSIVEVIETAFTSIDISEVAHGFSPPGLHMLIPKFIEKLEDEMKAQTYIKCYRSSFHYDPANKEIRWYI